MARDFTLSVVAPDKSVVEERATSVVCSGMDGYFGILAGHVPLIAALKPGVMEYMDANGQRHFVAIGGGFVEVTEGKVTVLADDAARAQDIDIAVAETTLEEARRALRGEASRFSREEATSEVEKSIERIRAARLVAK